MEYRIENNAGDLRVIFSGDITFTQNVSFRNMLKDISSQSANSCVFDLNGVGMVDSAGLGMFLIAKEQADTGGWKLHLAGATGHVASMLKLTKLSEIIEAS
ncbi:STAS domain-containing protein [Kordiimonas sp. SCSIO 12610]|uniref:STAS domain-containing protein n=1 Tax=Kordiimonas sp. SCSIO 12610 TaxID=2829597 RepID=UPI00210A6648|nr:STAS domain-containing protein [Kordiimonas sp. SCSIO 12610]UTW56727.1 STAS domain-containing protein [Kordiimonas sp. SCSIO 12610]